MARASSCVLGIVLCATATSPARADADCPPVAVTEGEAALADSIATRLASAGIATSVVEGCPVVRVVVAARGERVHLTITDGFDRSTEREVSDVRTAATVVESWTLQEIDPARASAAVPVSSPLAAERAAEPLPVVPPAVPVAAIGAAAELSIGSDGSSWYGVVADGCARSGRVCIGGRARLAADGGSSVSELPTQASVLDVSALASLDLPLAIGRLVVRPGVGVGGAWSRTSEQHHDGHGPFTLVRSTASLRAELHVSAALAVGRWLAVTGELSGEGSPLASDAHDGPRGFGRGSLGLRVGWP